MATRAQNAPASNRGNAGDKTNGAIKVVMPDANGDFAAAIPKSAIDKVQVVDVDMVLQLKDGTTLVLAGGAISAMDASHTEVKFTDGPRGLSNLFDLVGTIAIPKLDPILSSLQGQPNAEGQGANHPAAESGGMTASVTSQIVNQLTQIVQVNAQSVTIKTVDPTAQVAVLSQNTKTGDVASQPLQHVEPPMPPERPGVIPQEHIIGPDAPAMALTLVNLATIIQNGNVLYGSGGTPVSATDGSNNAQFAPQVINAPADATEIHAISNIPPNDFIKVVNIAVTGDGIIQSVTIKGVPAGMSIVNGTDLGGGNWSVPLNPGQRDFAVQIEYTTTPANPSAPIHQQFSLEFDVVMTTTDGVVNLSQVKQFVVKDVNTANDLTYIDSTTGEGVYVLPAQGNSHIIHAGDAGVTIYGSNAADFLYGGAGVDTINGGSGNSYFEGGGGADHLNGGAGGINTAGYTQSALGVTVDLVTGTGTGGDAQGDTLLNIQNVIGSSHDDKIISGTAANNINGGGGSDTVSYEGSGAAVIVDLAAGTGAGIGSNAAGDKLTGIQNIIGSAHNDTFLASAAANAFEGGGHDLTGVDTVSYANDTSGTGVIVDLSTLQNGVRTGGAAAGDTYHNIQSVIGTAFADTFIDGAGANRYDGTSLGATGLDTVDYRDSDAGVKVNFAIGRGFDGYAEGDSYVNVQNVVGSSHDDTFNAGTDSKSFNGGAGGFDAVTYTNAASGVIIDTINNVGHGAAEGNTYVGIEKFGGSGSNDIFIASDAANSFDGGGQSAGSDTVDYSNSGAAVTVDLFFADGQGTSGGYAQGDALANIANLIGGAGDDLFFANATQNSFDGRGGVNTISYEHSSSSNSTGVTVDLSATDGSGTDGNYALGDKYTHIQNVIGSHFNDTFVASSEANVFTGNGGSDTVSYAKSTSLDATGVTVNLLLGQGTGDFAQGDTYNAIQNVTGSAYDDTFVANAAANTFTGGGGSDTVSYAGSVVTVNLDLVNGVGVGGNAEGDKYIDIQNVIGGDADDIFIDSLAANTIDGGTVSLHNRVSYANSVSAPGVAAGVTVDLNLADGSGNSGGYAAGDKLSNIQDLTGSAADDTFGASLAANNLDGGASTAASHNRVSYASSVDAGGAAAGVTVDLFNGVGTGGFAQGDTYTNIQDVTGSRADDLVVANAAANSIDGGTDSLHNRVSYANSVTSAGAAAGVTIDLNLADGSGNSGGFAAGDKLVNIQDLTGSTADDTFVASAAANMLDGGASTAASHNRVSYIASVDGNGAAAGVTVDLAGQTGSGGYAQGDTYANIQDATGSKADDIIIASLASNHLDGADGVDTVSYAAANNNIGVTVNLVSGQGSGAGSFAENDTYANIENVIGTQYNDTFYASEAANLFTGGGAGVDTVNYSLAPNDGNGVTVDLVSGNGAGGYAAGDKYVGIQNATGTVNNDTFVGNGAANAFVGFGGVDTVDYSTANGGAVTIDFSTATGTGTGGLAQGDTYVGIRNAIGGEFDDTFTANTDVNAATSNRFDGGASTAASHNKVSYAGTATGVTVNLVTGQGTDGAIGDRYVNIQDVLGTAANDTIVASAAANTIDGGGTSLHNRVDYSASVDANGVAVGVVVDLNQPNGSNNSGGYAAGDKLSNIQDLTGSGADDLFIASTADNAFDGGVSTAASHNRVSYAQSVTGVTVDLSVTNGTGTSGGAQGDTFINIQDVTGSTQNDTFFASTANNNFDGLGGSDTVSYARVVGATGVTVDLSAGGAGTTGAAAGDTYTSIENVVGTANNDIFIDGSGAVPNAYNGGAGGVDTVSYAASNDGVGVQVNFGTGLNTGTGAGGFATGDTYIGIRNVVGTAYDDTFTASTTVSAATANRFEGGDGTLHNRVSYAGTGTAVTVNLVSGLGTVGAANDVYVNIQDVTGTALDDTIVASLAANNIDGGTGSLHNRVSYASSVGGVTVDLITGVGVGGFADGDKLTNIQDLTGSDAVDTFVASQAANAFDGGTGSDTVDYTSSTAVTINLSATATAGGLAAGTGAGGLAAGDTYTGIENIKGSAFADLFYAGAAANVFTGGGGIDTVSYAQSTVTGVTASLVLNAAGVGGDALNDSFIDITNLTGSKFADDLTGLVGGGSTLDGGLGNDALHGTGGTNTLIGGGGDDAMDATGNGNVFIGGAGGDTMSGTGINNTADYTGSTAVVVDLVTGLGGGAAGSDAIGDHLSGIQNVRGGAGDDLFVGNVDANVFTGNGGNDTVSYFRSGASVVASLLAGVGGTVGDAIGDSYTGIFNLTGGSANDQLTGRLLGSSTLIGNAGDDRLIATGGNNMLIGGAGADNMSATDANNTASYAGSGAGVTVNLTATDGTGTFGGDAAGDKLSGIQNLIGSDFADTFILDHSTNVIVGGTGLDTVSYEFELASVNVTVNLSNANGFASGNGAFGANDTFTGIENAIGGAGNDIFIAGLGANVFDGRGGADTVSYAADNAAAGITANAAGVTVDLFNHSGSGNWAQGDTYAAIENVIGTGGNDIFIDAGDGVHNVYDGGVNLAGSNDTVSYRYTSSGGLLTIGLDNNLAHNTGNANSAGGVGDTYSHIANLTGSETMDTTIHGDANANILTALGAANTNILDGGGAGSGFDVLDGRLGGHNTLIAGASGATVFQINAEADHIASNIEKIQGAVTANTTLDLHNLGSTLDISTFSVIQGDGHAKVSQLTTLDLQDGADTDKGVGATTGTRITISSQDIINLGKEFLNPDGSHHSELTVKLDDNDSILLVTPPGQYQVATGNNDYVFYDSITNQEIARLHQTH